MRYVIDYLTGATEETRLRYANHVWKSALLSITLDNTTAWVLVTDKPLGINSNTDMANVNKGYAQMLSRNDITTDARLILNDARHLWYWLMQRIGKDETLDTVEEANGGIYA